MGLSYGSKEAVYLSNFLKELQFESFSSVPINCDSTGALTVAGNATYSSRRAGSHSTSCRREGCWRTVQPNISPRCSSETSYSKSRSSLNNEIQHKEKWFS